MSSALNLRTAALLSFPPLLWAANAVVGRLVSDLAPPATLNLLRWLLALALLAVWVPAVRQLWRPGHPLWAHWQRYAWLGLLGVGCYNTLQYLALHTSTPLNVTLVASSTPIWMLGIGVLFFGQRLERRQIAGAVLSIAGVLLVLSRGSWQVLSSIALTPGDLYILLATMAWGFYSWLLSTTREPAEVRTNWAVFLMAQMIFGLCWSALFTGFEWGTSSPSITWGWPLLAALAFVAVGPSLLAYRAWGQGVSQVGPNVAGFFVNLTPLFAAVLSAAFLGEWPKPYHGLAFLLIVGGIVVSSGSKTGPKAGVEQT
jgi:drug/metabolite transporter (DMT)-like permease